MSDGSFDRTYSSLDLFSGAGGMSLGLDAAGFACNGAIEIDEIAGETYRRNIGEQDGALLGPTNGDIRETDMSSLKAGLCRAGINELDLLAAAPPCQGFSRVGRGKLDSMASRVGAFLEDERNGLFRHAVLVLEELRPRVFVFENVPGMLHLRGSNMVEAVCEAVADLGYEVRASLLNAAWYGVPQTRERVFVVGVRSDLGITPRFPTRQHSVSLTRGHLSCAELDPGNWKNPEYFVKCDELPAVELPEPPTTASMALDDLPPFTEHLRAAANGHRYRARRELFAPVPYRKPPGNWFSRLMREWSETLAATEAADHFCRWTPRDFETFSRMKPGDRYPQAVQAAQARYFEAFDRWQHSGGRRPEAAEYVPPYSLEGFPDKWRKLIPDLPAWTVTAHLSRDTYSHIHYDSAQARGITIREAARLQSFPDAFSFAGNMGDVFRQIGNAVPPLLARAVGEAVIGILKDADGGNAQGTAESQKK